MRGALKTTETACTNNISPTWISFFITKQLREQDFGYIWHLPFRFVSFRFVPFRLVWCAPAEAVLRNILVYCKDHTKHINTPRIRIHFHKFIAGSVRS
jgi:hypothetical protein